MASKRKGDGQRGDNQQNRKRWKQQPQKEQLSGPGILLTTVRRKERKAGLELIEFLNDLVPKLYPDLDLSVAVPADEWDGTVARGAPDGDVDGDGEDDDWDALRNGQPSVQAASSSPAIHPKEGKPTSSGEDDIEAKIQAELAELRPQKKGRGGLTGESGVRERFRLVDPEVECLMFVAVAWPMDPVELSCALLDEVAKTGQVRGRFIQRLSPIYGTCRAEKDKLEALARTVVAKHFSKSPDSQTFKVDPRIRLHNQLGKMDVIQSVAAQVPAPHRAELTGPDFLFNVEILKMTVGIGILPRYEEYKRFNPQMIAQKHQATATDELASRTAEVAAQTTASAQSK